MVVLLLLPLLLYSSSLHLPAFFLDDAAYFAFNPVVKDGRIGGLLDVWTRFSFGYTPITHLSIWIDQRIGFEGLWFSRLHTLLWFGISVCGVKAFVSRLTGSSSIGFLIALLYAVHPISAPSCLWLALRRQVVCLAFMWWSLAWFLRATDDRKTIPSLLALSALLGACAMLGRFQAVVAAPIACICLWYRGWRLTNILVTALPLGLVAFLFTTASILFADPTSLSMHRLGGTMLGSIWADGEILLRYLGMVVWPWNLTIYYSVSEDPGWRQLAGWGLVVALMAAGTAAVRQRRLFVVCLTCSFMATLPTLNIINQTYAMGDHYLQPALPFLLLATVVLLWDLADRLGKAHLLERWRMVVALVLATLLTLGSWIRIPHFASEVQFLRQAVQASPTAGFWWAYLSRWLAKCKDPELRSRSIEAAAKAMECQDAARADSITVFHVLYDWARHLVRQGNYPGAVTLVETYWESIPDSGPTLMALVNMLGNQPQAAVDRLEPTLQPEHWSAMEKDWARYQQDHRFPLAPPKGASLTNPWGLSDVLEQGQASRVFQIMALLTLGEAYLKAGQPDKSARIALACALRFPFERQNWLLLEEALTALGDADGATMARNHAAINRE